jgi:hypothetical protein
MLDSKDVGWRGVPLLTFEEIGDSLDTRAAFFWLLLF